MGYGCPVTREGARHWSVYFPSGIWHDFWTNDIHEGESAAEIEAPLDRLALFVRDGAIVPMTASPQHVEEAEEGGVELLVYPNRHSSYELYEDDGMTNDYRRRITSILQEPMIGSACAVTHGFPTLDRPERGRYCRYGTTNASSTRDCRIVSRPY